MTVRMPSVSRRTAAFAAAIAAAFAAAFAAAAFVTAAAGPLLRV